MLNKVEKLLHDSGKTKADYCHRTNTLKQNFNRLFNQNVKVKTLYSLCDYLGYSLQIKDKDGNLITDICKEDFE